MGDLRREGSIGRGTSIWRVLIWPIVVLALLAGLFACSDNELVVVGPEQGDQQPTVEAVATPSTTVRGSTTSSTVPTSSTSSTTSPPDGDSSAGTGTGTVAGAPPGGSTPGTGPAPTSPPTVAPPPAGSAATFDEGAADLSLAFVNRKRSQNSRAILASDPDLNAAALDWARQLAASGNLGHNPNLRGVVPSRYGYIGENVAYSWTSENIDQGWWESQGHHDNILGAHYTAVGIAFVVDPDGTYWAVQVFGG